MKVVKGKWFEWDNNGWDDCVVEGQRTRNYVCSLMLSQMFPLRKLPGVFRFVASRGPRKGSKRVVVFPASYIIKVPAVHGRRPLLTYQLLRMDILACIEKLPPGAERLTLYVTLERKRKK